MEDDTVYLTMAVPNWEVNYIYKNTIRKWFDCQVRAMDFSDLYCGLMNLDTDRVQDLLKRQLRKTISYHDSGEAFYHGFLLGLLNGIQGYHIRSNRECGDGRPDILLVPLDETWPVIIIEIKCVDRIWDLFLQEEQRGEGAEASGIGVYFYTKDT